jgi:TonB-dependent SusC/RagA subfamily outer membrane receptor
VARTREVALLLLSIAAACGGKPKSAPVPKDQATVTADDMSKHTEEPIEKMLQGKVPGLLVSRTGDGQIAVQIRGATSFAERTQTPLYILDGLPFQPGKGGVLSGVDPYSIQEIKVLRGTEAGIYGIEGANGVILIKTKRGPSRP